MSLSNAAPLLRLPKSSVCVARTHGSCQSSPTEPQDVLRGVGSWQPTCRQPDFRVPWDAMVYGGSEGRYNTAAIDFEGDPHDRSRLALEPLPLELEPENDKASTMTAESRDSQLHNSLSYQTVTQSTPPPWDVISSDLCLSTPSGRNTCSICYASFGNSELLEQHARAARHRLYRCPVEGCRSSYYRRDVFIRHKSTHRPDHPHTCRICAQRGYDKAFKRRDHLKQHVRNCHAEVDNSRRWLWDMSECPPNGIDLSLGWEVPTGWMTPADFSDEDLAPMSMWSTRNTAQSQVNVRDDPAQCDRDGYRSQAVKAIECEFVNIVGDDLAELRTLKERLGLYNGSTTTDLALNLRKLALDQNVPCGDVVEVEQSPRPAKRRTAYHL